MILLAQFCKQVKASSAAIQKTGAATDPSPHTSGGHKPWLRKKELIEMKLKPNKGAL
jgi:hypothetical protein